MIRTLSSLAALAFFVCAAVTPSAHAKYIIDYSGLAISANGGAAQEYEDPTDTADPSFNGVNLGNFDPVAGDTLEITKLYYGFDVEIGDPIPPSAGTNDNYFLRDDDAVSVDLTIDGTTTNYALSESFGPAGNKGQFGFSDAPSIDLLAAVGNVPGTYDVSYRTNYSFHYWDSSNVQASSTHAPITTAATFTITAPVPEPTSIVLWSILGLVGLGYVAWRRKK